MLEASETYAYCPHSAFPLSLMIKQRHIDKNRKFKNYLDELSASESFTFGCCILLRIYPTGSL
jgi:hypothetical protein